MGSFEGRVANLILDGVELPLLTTSVVVGVEGRLLTGVVAPDPIVTPLFNEPEGENLPFNMVDQDEVDAARTAAAEAQSAAAAASKSLVMSSILVSALLVVSSSSLRKPSWNPLP